MCTKAYLIFNKSFHYPIIEFIRALKQKFNQFSFFSQFNAIKFEN